LIVIDPSAIVALLDRRHPGHAWALAVLERKRDPVVVPAAALASVDRAVTAGVGPRAIDAVLGALIDGSLLLDCGDVDPPRMRELLATGLDVDLADAAVAACAERLSAGVLSVGPRGLRALERDGTVTLLR
jgi:predicted nucleic acid-binding protein